MCERESKSEKGCIFTKTPKARSPAPFSHRWPDSQSHLWDGVLEGKIGNRSRNRDQEDEGSGEAGGGEPAESVPWIKAFLGWGMKEAAVRRAWWLHSPGNGLQAPELRGVKDDTVHLANFISKT